MCASNHIRRFTNARADVFHTPYSVRVSGLRVLQFVIIWV